MYELLTGARPYDVAGKTLDEILRIVVEEEPRRPSAAIGALDAGTRPDRRRLKGDLDAIVLKAMSKEALRRYASAQELSEDITRHLTGRPVVAREPSFGYLARRLALRHKAAFLSAAVSLLVIVGALLLAIREAHVAAAERDRARIEAAKANQVASFLRTLFSSAYPRNRVPGAKLSAQDLLENGVARVDQELGSQPEVQASMLAILGAVYTEMGSYEQALPLVERSLALRENLLGPEHADVAESLYNLGRLKRFLGEFEAAQPYLERAVKIREQTGNPDDLLLAEALAELGNVFWYRGRPEGRVYLERAVAIEERAGGPQLSRWLTALSNFDVLTGDLDNAQRLLERAIEVGNRVEGRPGFLVSVTILNLGEVLRDQEDYSRAQARLEQALEIAVQLYGPEHQATVYNWAELGELHLAMGEHEKAREYLDRSISVGQRILGPDHVGIAAPLTYLGRLLLAEGRAQEAKPLFERAMRIREKTHGPKHPFVAENLLDLGRVAMQLEGYAAAEPLLRRALAIQRETLQPGHRDLVPTLTALAESLPAQDAQVEARKLLNEAVRIARAKLPAHHSQRAHAEAALERLQAAR
jgi:serine/threonine-protein kinase